MRLWSTNAHVEKATCLLSLRHNRILHCFLLKQANMALPWKLNTFMYVVKNGKIT